MKLQLITMVSTAFFLLSCLSLQAHPSWGMVVNAKGELFFSDVLHGGEGTIWKYDTEGRLMPFIREFHAHGLCIDSEGTLWISANRYIEGVIEGEGEHVLINVYPDGKREELVRTRNPKEFFGGTTTLDPDGNMIYSYKKQLYKRTQDGKVSLLLDHTFERIITIFTGKDGAIYIADKNHKDGTIFRLLNGQLSELANNLVDPNPKNPPFRKSMYHLLFGMEQDNEGNIYVAESGTRRILKITPSGKVSTFYGSNSPWYPTGIVMHEGTAYIMEVGFRLGHLGPRIIEISPTKEAEVIVNVKNYNPKDSKKGSIVPVHSPQNPFPFHLIFILLFGLISLGWWKRKVIFKST